MDPLFSRWMSVDPAMQETNWYGYCNGNLVNYVDPDGRMLVPISPFDFPEVNQWIAKNAGAIIEIVGGAALQAIGCVSDLGTITMFLGGPPTAGGSTALVPVTVSVSTVSKVAGAGLMAHGAAKLASSDLSVESKTLKSQAPNVYPNSGIKGDLAEEVADVTMRKAGYKKLPSKVGSNNGFDGLYVKYGKNGKIKDIIINESKFGKADLSTTKQGYLQMGPDWIKMNINKMLKSSDPSVKDAGQLLQKNQNLIRTKMNHLGYDGVNKWISNPGGFGR